MEDGVLEYLEVTLGRRATGLAVAKLLLKPQVSQSKAGVHIGFRIPFITFNYTAAEASRGTHGMARCAMLAFPAVLRGVGRRVEVVGQGREE